MDRPLRSSFPPLTPHSHKRHFNILYFISPPIFSIYSGSSGLKEWFAAEGVKRCVELDWWQQVTVPKSFSGDGYKGTCTPSQHWSNRGLLDRNETLWVTK